MPPRDLTARAGAAERAGDTRGPITFGRLKWTSVLHSTIYAALLYVAFVAGKPEPATFVLGLAHGLLWIGMSLVCLLAVRLHVIPLRIAVAVAVVGGIGPFVGTIEFLRYGRRPGPP